VDQNRRRAPGRWLLAVPVLTGAAGGPVPLAAQLALVLAALVTAALLWRGGRRTGCGLRGWTLLSFAVLLGVLGASVVRVLHLAVDAGPPAPARLLAPLPAVLLAIAGVVSLLTWQQLRRGGARLLTETALFFSAAMVLSQVLVVGPALTGAALGATSGTRLAVELSCLATAALLSSVLLVVSASAGPRRATGALLLLAAGTQATAHGLALVGGNQHIPAFSAAVPATQLLTLVLVCLAVLRDPGPQALTPPTRSADRLSRAGQLLPHLVMVVAALLFVGSAVLGAPTTPTAGVAVLAGLVLTAVHRAVTARDEARVAARLHDSEAYFRSLVRSSSDAVLILDSALQVTWAAPTLSDAAAAAGHRLVGTALPAAVHPDDADAVTSWLAGHPTGGLTGLRTFRLPSGGGGWRVLEAGVSDLRADADVGALVLHCRDVTARLDREDELHSIAFTDPLTGLPNRAAQLAALGTRLAAFRDRSGTPGAGTGPGTAALLLFDLQGLHDAREQAGGDVVDVALVEVARRLRATLRGEDHLARFGAESFSVLAAGTTAEADRVAARCLSVIEQPLSTDMGLVDLTAAVGLVPLVAGLTERAALERAELAVGDARAAGPGTVRRYRDALGAARDRRDRLRRDLVGARERGELALAWQPIVHLADHRITAVEVLLRWRHPLYGDIEPEEFLPLAERAGLVVDVQRWVLAEATAAIAGLLEQATDLRLSVNVSPHHFAAGTLVADVGTALRTSGLAPERLIVEITESALRTAGGHVTDDIAALRLMGVRLALDDFGGRCSSLPALAQLRVDVIKIDPTLLARIDRDAYPRALCQAVVGIGASLGVEIVAEGVETTSQLTALEAIGCGSAQGFLLSRPLALGGLVTLLEQGAGSLWPGIPSRA
jgi:diguanylate cyclase (GGDEF)-like protein/PAS domain S-box-containing protein